MRFPNLLGDEWMNWSQKFSHFACLPTYLLTHMNTRHCLGDPTKRIRFALSSDSEERRRDLLKMRAKTEEYCLGHSNGISEFIQFPSENQLKMNSAKNVHAAGTMTNLPTV